jgi:hypothetical protein
MIERPCFAPNRRYRPKVRWKGTQKETFVPYRPQDPNAR